MKTIHAISSIIKIKLLIGAILLVPGFSNIAKSQYASPNPVCYGTPINLFCNLTGCEVPGATFAWHNTSGSWTSNEANPVILPGSVGYATDRFYLEVRYSPPPGGFSGGSVFVTVNTPPALTITPSQAICLNDIFQINVTSTLSNYNNYIWSPVSNLFSDGACTIPYTGSSATTLYAKPVSTITYTCNANNTSTGCSNSAHTTITINPLLPISISIMASANPVCAGTSVTFTATPANGGSTPAYQWLVNGVPFGTNSPTLTYVPATNDVVTCVLTSGASCVTGNPATSNAITILACSPGCGQPFTDARDGKTYNTVLIGTQCWMAQNLDVGTRINGASGQTNNNTIEKYCYDDLNANCDIYGGLYLWDEMMNYTTSSNSNPSGRQGICPGGWLVPSDADWSQLTIFLGGTAAAGGAMKETGTLHWANPNVGATNSSGFTGLPGGFRQTSGTFSSLSYMGYFWSSTEGSTTTSWSRYLNNGYTNLYRYAYAKMDGFAGRCIKDTCSVYTSVNVSIGASANPVCAGTPVTFTATPTNSGLTPSYQWKVNGTNVGTNSPTYTYTPANNDAITCVLTSNATCVTGNPATSNTITITQPAELSLTATITHVSCAHGNTGCINTQISGGAMPYLYIWNTGATTPGICDLPAGTYCVTVTDFNSCTKTGCWTVTEPSELTLTATITTVSCIPFHGCIYAQVTGGTSPYQYLWSNGATTSGICGLVSGTYCVTVVDSHLCTKYKCWTIGGCEPKSICYGDPIQLFCSYPEGCENQNATFHWENSSNTWQSSLRDPVINPGETGYGNDLFTLTMQYDPPPGGFYSMSYLVSVNPLLPVSVSIAASANPVCAGIKTIFTAFPVNGGAAPSYQWKVNGTDLLNATNATCSYFPNNGDLINCILSSSAACTSGNPDTSNTVAMVVNPLLPVSVTIVASTNPVCAGTPVTFTATPVNGGASPSFQWQVNNNSVGTNSSTYSYFPGNNDQVKCVLTSNAICPSSIHAYSNTLTMIVRPAAIAYAGPDATINKNETFTVTDASATNGIALLWTTTGTGTLTNAATLTPTYTPGTGEAGTTVKLCLIVFAEPPCPNDTDCMTISIIEPDLCDPSCCAFDLILFNDSNNTNTLSKIKVTTMGTTEIKNVDGMDELTLVKNLPGSVEFTVPGGNFSVGEAMDYTPTFYFKQADYQKIKVEFFNDNGVMVCQQIIEIPCRMNYSEDEDWTQYTSTTAINDTNYFAFLVQNQEIADEDIEDCGFDETEMMATSSCDFQSTITCTATLNVPQYLITVTGPSGFDIYNWNVTDDTGTPLNSFTTQNFNFTVTNAGSYTIKLLANTNATGEAPCIRSNAVIIPLIQPEKFASTQGLCTRTLTFDASLCAEDQSDVSSYSWSCSGVTGFPTSGQSISYTFAQDGTYNITLTILDKYGCTHAYTNSVPVSLVGQPAFHPTYTFCPCIALPKQTINIDVSFVNESKGAECPITWSWNFGDPNSGSNNTSTVINPVHQYKNVQCNGQNYTVTLTMSGNGQSTSTLSKVIEIKPCNVSFTYVVCPDGRVNVESNIDGKWDFPGVKAIAPWPYSKGNHRVVRYENTGDYEISFTGQCDDGGKCKVTKTIHVELICCVKNETDRYYTLFTAGGHDYRMDYKLEQRQLPLYHIIRAKTKLKMHHYLLSIRKHKKMYYWHCKKADEIEATVTGKIYMRDGGTGGTGCSCKIEKQIDASDIRPRSGNHNSRKAKCYVYADGRYRSRKNTLESTHRVKIGSAIIIKNLFLGHEPCDDFHWWNDWY